jgi:hypothetical protein
MSRGHRQLVFILHKQVSIFSLVRSDTAHPNNVHLEFANLLVSA